MDTNLYCLSTDPIKHKKGRITDKKLQIQIQTQRDKDKFRHRQIQTQICRQIQTQIRQIKITDRSKTNFNTDKEIKRNSNINMKTQ